MYMDCICMCVCPCMCASLPGNENSYTIYKRIDEQCCPRIK